MYADYYPFGRDAVIVARVSTFQQTTEAQVQDLTNWAEQQGYNILQTFRTTESGFLQYDKKEGWNLVTDFFDNHPECRVLICSELSRLSRKKDILMQIEQYLEQKKIQLIIKDIDFKLLKDNGELDQGKDIIFTLYASLASSEMRQKKERMKRGRAILTMKGYSIGGKVLFGYNRKYVLHNGRNRSYYEINPEQAAELIQIYKWYAYGIDGCKEKSSIFNITKECIKRGMSQYLHSRRNVNKALKEYAYTGQKTTHNRVKNAEYWNYKKEDAPKYLDSEEYLCVYPRIFTGDNDGLFEIVQSKLKENNSKISANITIDKSKIHTTILSRLIKCPNCGRYYVAEYRKTKTGRNSFAYRCPFSRSRIVKCTHTHLENVQLLDSIVYKQCQDGIAHMMFERSMKDSNSEIQKIRDQINNLEEHISKISNGIDALNKLYKARVNKLSGRENVDNIIKEYETELDARIKEQEDYQKDIITLRSEAGKIQQQQSLLADFNKSFEQVDDDKQSIYKYVHALVSSVEFVYAHQFETVIKINYSSAIPDYLKRDGYVCIFKSTHKGFSKAALITYEDWIPVDDNDENAIPIYRNKDIKWDDNAKSFITSEGVISLDSIHNFCLGKPLNAQHQTSKIKVIPIEYKLLNCYQND